MVSVPESPRQEAGKVAKLPTENPVLLSKIIYDEKLVWVDPSRKGNNYEPQRMENWLCRHSIIASAETFGTLGNAGWWRAATATHLSNDRGQIAIREPKPGYQPTRQDDHAIWKPTHTKQWIAALLPLSQSTYCRWLVRSCNTTLGRSCCKRCSDSLLG